MGEFEIIREGHQGHEETISKLPSLDGRGGGRVETGRVTHPHPASPIEGEEWK
jgi:hypothetical protein